MGRHSKSVVHGHTTTTKKSPTYVSWANMKARVNQPSTPSYRYYGGRGIKYDERWADFANFLADMGERPEGCTLDRIDPDKDYGPDNCRWADKYTQSRNRKRR